jgi:hypothetical protein
MKNRKSTQKAIKALLEEESFINEPEILHVLNVLLAAYLAKKEARLVKLMRPVVEQLLDETIEDLKAFKN